MSTLASNKANFGTAPVFLTAISTILGAVMFLRFGYAVGNVGFMGTLLIIVIGHLVTIPTAMAIAEIATNQKVEGGGEYFIISRSFGINIGASIGIALYFSQAISVAFYVIAFAEAFKPLIGYINEMYHCNIPLEPRLVSLPAMLLLALLMLTKGADLGMKALYVVIAILTASIVMFFLGTTEYSMTTQVDLNATSANPAPFFLVFAICFPAFTGMTAGVGLSGDLKDPKKSIPLGTLAATILGMIVYVFIAYKLSVSIDPEALADPNNSLIMSRIALWGPIIPIGLAAATFSSALGSIMVAPRTLQALAGDGVFGTEKANNWINKSTVKNEPKNATIITCGIAIVFVCMGDVNAVAEVISMFFMVTYGALCAISFFQHFAADPSYRPSFKSRWYISLFGAILCIYLMFRINSVYAIASLILMVAIYLLISNFNKEKQGMTKIFQGVIFQLMRRIQVFVQKVEKDEKEDNWRPTVLCLSKETFNRPAAFDFMRYVSHRYGFGSYIHHIDGYFSHETNEEAKDVMKRMISMTDISKSNVYLDTIISPSYTNSIVQALQMPSVSGKEVNMFMFEYFKDEKETLDEIVENLPLISSASNDICILQSSQKGFGYKDEIHIWITPYDFDNASLMILLGYILTGHPEWKKAQIKIFAVFPEEEVKIQKEKLLHLIKEGRLPISANNIEVLIRHTEESSKELISKHSKDSDLTIIGFRTEVIKMKGKGFFDGFESLNNILFVNTLNEKTIS